MQEGGVCRSAEGSQQGCEAQEGPVGVPSAPSALHYARGGPDRAEKERAAQLPAPLLTLWEGRVVLRMQY